MEECPASLLYMSREESRPLAVDPDLFERVGGGLVDLLDAHIAAQGSQVSATTGVTHKQREEHHLQERDEERQQRAKAAPPSIFDTAAVTEPITTAWLRSSLPIEQQALDPRVAMTIEEANAHAAISGTASSASAAWHTVTVSDAAHGDSPLLLGDVGEHLPPRIGTVRVVLDLPKLGIQPHSILDTCCLVESLQEAVRPQPSSSWPLSSNVPCVSISSSLSDDMISARDGRNAWTETWRAAGKPTGDDSLTDGRVKASGKEHSGETILLAWEHLHNKVPTKLSRLSPFVSESSASVFDALYRSHTADAFALNMSPLVVPHNVLIQQIFLLIQGTPSTLFSYNSTKRMFELTADQIRIEGCSETSVTRLLEQFLATGTHMRRLIHAVDLCIHHPEGMGLTRIAFGRALWSYLSTLQNTVLSMQDEWPRDSDSPSGFLELYECTREMSTTLEQLAKLCCCHILQDMSDKRVARYGFYLPHGAGLLTLLFDHIDKTPSADSLWSALLMSILEQTSQPYCDMLSRWLGITPESSGGRAVGQDDVAQDAAAISDIRREFPLSSFQFGDHIHRHLQGLDSFVEFFVQSKSAWVFEGSHPLLFGDDRNSILGSNGLDNHFARGERVSRRWDDEFQINPSCPPAAFISEDLAHRVLDAGKALQMMLEYEAQHPLANAANMQPLRWVFSQKELKQVHRQLEEQRRLIMSKMVERLRAKGLLADKQRQAMELDHSSSYSMMSPLSPHDNPMMHVEIRDLQQLGATLPDYPGIGSQASLWDPFIHREQLGSFFSYSKLYSEASASRTPDRHQSYISTMESLLGSTTDGQEGEPQLQQQEYALLPMAVLAQECISYPLKAHTELIDTCFVSFFFHDLHLLDHWRTMDRFMLMRDGVFVTRLSEALFDDESGFIQQQLDKALQHGRLLGSDGGGGDVRGTMIPWPPRGGELEAALRTVLLDAFQVTDPTNAFQTGVLDETLAFAVKEYSEDTAICRDIHAIEALDFLYLDYRPPSPVQMLILQPHIMEKYTRLFSFHLRLLRVHASMRQCFHHLRVLSKVSSDNNKAERQQRRSRHDDASKKGGHGGGGALQAGDFQFLQRFRFEAEQVLEGLRGYLFDTAVGANWTMFMRRMKATKSRVEARLAMEEGTAGTSSTTGVHHAVQETADEMEDDEDDGDIDNNLDDLDSFDSLPAIQEAHQRMLDQILVQALLKQKQRPVLRVVHEVLSCMIQFNKLVRELFLTLEAGEVAAKTEQGANTDDDDEDMEEGAEENTTTTSSLAVQEHMQRVRAQHERFQAACSMLVRVLKALDASTVTTSNPSSSFLPTYHQDSRSNFLQQLLVRLGWLV